MKAHIGVDSKTKLIHPIAVTPGNYHDSQMLSDLLHGEETGVWGDSADTGKKTYRNRPLSDQGQSAKRYKSIIRARVEPVFGVMKRQFGYNKVRYQAWKRMRTAY